MQLQMLFACTISNLVRIPSVCFISIRAAALKHMLTNCNEQPTIVSCMDGEEEDPVAIDDMSLACACCSLDCDIPIIIQPKHVAITHIQSDTGSLVCSIYESAIDVTIGVKLLMVVM